MTKTPPFQVKSGIDDTFNSKLRVSPTLNGFLTAVLSLPLGSALMNSCTFFLLTAGRRGWKRWFFFHAGANLRGGSKGIR